MPLGRKRPIRIGSFQNEKVPSGTQPQVHQHRRLISLSLSRSQSRSIARRIMQASASGTIQRDCGQHVVTRNVQHHPIGILTGETPVNHSIAIRPNRINRHLHGYPRIIRFHFPSMLEGYRIALQNHVIGKRFVPASRDLKSVGTPGEHQICQTQTIGMHPGSHPVAMRVSQVSGGTRVRAIKHNHPVVSHIGQSGR
ncbi:MAG: hypothetical protein BWY82_00840 [Verrucomicrobia bacterium ADurb.Bin474]|nr:MAG: hypothetical protein BWY82_00840 [Verrucomicrobia bacterium ADurb.Bin474]